MLIDEKGRLFGKINVIDLAVIIFILSLAIPLVYYSWRIAHERKNTSIHQIMNYEVLRTQIQQVETMFKKYPRLRRYLK